MIKHTNKATRAIVAEASDWLVRLNDPDLTPGDEQAFAQWLRRSPVHVREYLRAEATWSALEDVDPTRLIDIDSLLQETNSNVIALRTGANDSTYTVQKPGRWQRLGAVAGIAAAVILSLVLVWTYFMPTGERYDTGLGEQRRLVLEDSSVIELNTQSIIEVQFDETMRAVRLLAGEALFTVARDPERPFVVSSDVAEVRALGTQFNVYRMPDQTVVTVLEGRVVVQNIAPPDSDVTASADSAAADLATIELAVGDRAEVVKNTPIRKAEAILEQVVAWRERRLIFDNEPLAGVLAEFNRYNTRQMFVRDEMLAAVDISGVFDADQPDVLVQFLTQYAAIEAIKHGDSNLEIRPAR